MGKRLVSLEYHLYHHLRKRKRKKEGVVVNLADRKEIRFITKGLEVLYGVVVGEGDTRYDCRYEWGGITPYIVDGGGSYRSDRFCNLHL